MVSKSVIVLICNPYPKDLTRYKDRKYFDIALQSCFSVSLHKHGESSEW